jgi:hypothetical protein
VKLGYRRYWPWPERYRDSKFVHSRCMLPQATRLRSLDGKSSEGFVVLMPYISYEDSQGYRRYNHVVNMTTLSARYDNNLGDDGSTESSDDESVAMKRLQFITSRTKSTWMSSSQSLSATLVDHVDGSEAIIKAYLNYSHQNNDLPLHPRRYADL